MVIKLSYLAFYLRLMPSRRERLFVYAATAFVVVLGVTYTLLSAFLCTPVARSWDKSLPGTCMDETAFLLSNAAINMVADVIIFVLPIPALWSLHGERLQALWNQADLLSLTEDSSLAATPDSSWHVHVWCSVGLLALFT
jgi:hypothetical protein